MSLVGYFYKKEYLPGYTGHVPKKNDMFGLTAGEVNRVLVSRGGSCDATSQSLGRTSRHLTCSPALDALRYGNKSRKAANWIGGPTHDTHSQHIPGTWKAKDLRECSIRVHGARAGRDQRELLLEELCKDDEHGDQRAVPARCRLPDAPPLRLTEREGVLAGQLQALRYAFACVVTVLRSGEGHVESLQEGLRGLHEHD